MNIWLRNSEGKPDAVLTMTFMGFVVVLFKVVMGGVAVPFLDGYSFGEIDATVIGALLTPTLGAYVARRYTDKRWGPDGIPGTTDDEPVDEAQPSERTEV